MRLQPTVLMQNAAVATGNGTELRVRGQGTVLFQVTIATTATITFEGASEDGTYISLVNTVNLATGVMAATATATGLYRASVAGFKTVRARISSWTAGAVTVNGISWAEMTPEGASHSRLMAWNYTSWTPITTTANNADSVGYQDALNVNAFPYIYAEGTTDWHRVRGLKNDLTNLTGAYVPAVGLVNTTGSSWRPISQSGAGASSFQRLAVSKHGYNGSTYDPYVVNYEGTVFSSAARTATSQSSDQTNYSARGVVVTIDVTAVTDTPSVVFTIQGKSTLGSDYYTILASAAVTGTGQTVLRVYPGLTTAANTVANDVLPRVWRVDATHADTDSITYSVSANYIV